MYVCVRGMARRSEDCALALSTDAAAEGVIKMAQGPGDECVARTRRTAIPGISLIRLLVIPWILPIIRIMKTEIPQSDLKEKFSGEIVWYFLLGRAGDPGRKQNSNFFFLVSRGRDIFHLWNFYYQLMSDNYSPDLLPCFTLDDSSEWIIRRTNCSWTCNHHFSA